MLASKFDSDDGDWVGLVNISMKRVQVCFARGGCEREGKQAERRSVVYERDGASVVIQSEFPLVCSIHFRLGLSSSEFHLVA